MPKKLFYIIPGIFTPLEDARTWDYQAQAWFKARFPLDEAAGFNYAAGLLGADMALDRQAAMIADDLAKAQAVGGGGGAGFRIVIVAHSNGCRLALKALAKAPEVSGVDLHLFAAAVDRDCSKNGLNDLAEAGARLGGRLDLAALYVSPVDEVLALPIAYGTLGKDGPAWASVDLEEVLLIVRRNCSHCDWVGRDFETSMQAVADSLPDTTENA